MINIDLVRRAAMVRIRSGHSCGTGICLITFFVVSWILGRQGKQRAKMKSQVVVS